MPSPEDERIARLLTVHLYLRWAVVLCLWMTVGLTSLWALRAEIELWLDYFTWTAVRFALQYNRWAFLGLGLCVGATLGVLIWQSGHILLGILPSERRSLQKQLQQMSQWGKRHPFRQIRDYVFRS